MVITGDAANLTEDDSGMRLAACPGTTELITRSMPSITSLHHQTVKLRMAKTRPQLMRLFAGIGELQNADGCSSGVHVRIVPTAVFLSDSNLG